MALVAAIGTLATTFWLSPLSLRTLSKLEFQLLSSQAPFSVQPRVFDERFPRFILYVQDVEASATRWRGVFLASSDDATAGLGPHSSDGSDSKSQQAVTIAEDAAVIVGPARGQIELHLGRGSTHEYDPRNPDQYNVTTFGETDIPIDISAAVLPQKNSPLSLAERSVSALLSDNGPDWLQARVEFQRRIAFPAACLVFALLGVPIGVRPRRGGRAAGLILTLVLIGGYYFLFVSGDHMAVQGRVSPWFGVWAANIVGTLVGLIFLRRVESVRKPTRIGLLIESLWQRSRAVATAPTSNGSVSHAQPGVGFRQALGTGRAMAFPMLVDVYLLQQFFYYLFILLGAFLVIFDAFTLFDLLGDIARNHISALTVISYFRYLVPLMVYQLAPLATLVATLVTLAVLASSQPDRLPAQAPRLLWQVEQDGWLLLGFEHVAGPVRRPGPRLTDLPLMRRRSLPCRRH